MIPLHGRQRLRASGPEDLLALIPYLLGFQPSESLVMVMLHDQRVVLTARIDLPEGPEEFEQVVAHFSAVADQHDVEDCVAVVFSQEWGLAHIVLLCLAGAPELPVMTALHCDDGCFRMLNRDGDLDGPYDFDPQTTAAAAGAVVAGLTTLPDRESVGERIATGAREVTDRVVLAADDVDIPDGQAARAALMDRAVTRCLEGMPDRAPSDADCALLGLLCLDLEVRDVAWLRMDRPHAVEHRALWAEVARRMPSVLSAAPVALAGMAAWLEGDGALAWCCVDRAEAEHPGYGLSSLLQEILTSAVDPEMWAGLAEEIRAGGHHVL